jgi:hypothetical protein
MALLIYYNNISDEDANLALSGVTVNLLMQEDLDVSEGPEISLIGELSKIQWSALMPCLTFIIVLEPGENQEIMAAPELAKLLTITAEEVREMRF